jgi:hypothetical protein
MKIKLKGIKFKNIKRLRKTISEKEHIIKDDLESEEKIEHIQETEEVESENIEKEPVKEYRETLYSVGQEPQKQSNKQEIHILNKRKDFSSIESRIDDLEKDKRIKGSSDINRKVDMILSKKKK